LKRPLHWIRNDNGKQQESSISRRNKLARAVCTSLATSNSFMRKRMRDTPQIPSMDSSRPQTAKQQQFQTPTNSSKKKQSPLPSLVRDSTMVFRPTALAKIITDSVMKSQPKKYYNTARNGVDGDLIITTDDDDPSFYSGFGASNKKNTSSGQEVPLTDSILSININNRYTVSKEKVHGEQKILLMTSANVDYESPPCITNTGRKKQHKIGPFSQRLKYLRDSMKGNLIRFQSGQYPFQSCPGRMYSSKDANDPRTRASIFVDVTIHSELISLDGGYNVDLSMAFGFVHKVQRTRSKLHHIITETIVNELNGKFSWILFTIDTVRQYNVRQGTELRIYDFTCIPFTMSSLTNNYSIKNISMNKENDVQDDSEMATVKWALACTQFCEFYPSNVLPSWPKINYI
jgi:hypothetical protein